MSDGHRTSSIPRPDTSRRARVTADAPVRMTGHRRTRFVLGVLATGIVAAIAGAVVVLPVKAWVNQREELEAKKAELATLEDANIDLQADIDRLLTPEGIEDAARVELGYQMPGETRVSPLDTPAAPTDLPKRWPYSTVTQILAVRTGRG